MSPPYEAVTNRLPFIAASLGRVYTAGSFLSNGAGRMWASPLRGDGFPRQSADWRGNPFFQRSPPLDKPVGMGIIIDTRGHCDKRSAPLSVSDLIRLYSLQKPSPAGVAVFVFQLHNTNRNGIPPDVESKYPVHVCHPLSGL